MATYSDNENKTSCELLTKKELAKKLKVTTRSVDNYTIQKKIPFVQVGAFRRYIWKDVLTQLKDNNAA